MIKNCEQGKKGKIENYEEDIKGVMETLSSCTTLWKIEKSLPVHASHSLPFPTIPSTSFSRLPYTKEERI